MKGYGVSESMVKLCMAIYRRMQASVLLDGEKSRWFEVKNGLRQFRVSAVTVIV